jgi:hypothetical protein
MAKSRFLPPLRSFETFVFSLALALRLSFLGAWVWRGIGDTYGQDPYYGLARAWLGWIPWPGMDATHPPFYTLFIAAVLWCARTASPIPVQLLQCVLSSLTCLLVGSLGARLAGERVGRVAALWAALDLPMIFFVPQLQTETFFIFLEIVFIVWLYRVLSREKRGAGESYALGVLGGLAALTRSAFAAYPAFLALTLWKMRKTRGGLLFLAIVCAGWASPIAVWTARNWVKYRRVIPISAQMGWNLYEGFTLDRDEIRSNPFTMADEMKRLGITDPMVASDYYKAKTFRFMREHPLRSARIVAGKTLLYWRPWVYDPYTAAQRVLMTFYFSFLFAMSLLCVWENRRAPGDLWLLYGVMLYFTATHSVFETFLRYRLPLEPFLCILGAGGLVSLRDRFRPGRRVV